VKVDFVQVIRLDEPNQIGHIIPDLNVIRINIKPQYHPSTKVQLRFATFQGCVWIKKLASLGRCNDQDIQLQSADGYRLDEKVDENNLEDLSLKRQMNLDDIPKSISSLIQEKDSEIDKSVSKKIDESKLIQLITLLSRNPKFSQSAIDFDFLLSVLTQNKSDVEKTANIVQELLDDSVEKTEVDSIMSEADDMIIEPNNNNNNENEGWGPWFSCIVCKTETSANWANLALSCKHAVCENCFERTILKPSLTKCKWLQCNCGADINPQDCQKWKDELDQLELTLAKNIDITN